MRYELEPASQRFIAGLTLVAGVLGLLAACGFALMGHFGVGALLALSGVLCVAANLSGRPRD